MKKYTLFTALALSVCSTFTYAQPVSPPQVYPVMGSISRIQSKVIVIRDMQFPVLSTVKVFDKNGRKIEYADLKSGDRVGAKLLKLNNKNYVDSIHQIDTGSAAKSPVLPSK